MDPILCDKKGRGFFGEYIANIVKNHNWPGKRFPLGPKYTAKRGLEYLGGRNLNRKIRHEFRVFPGQY